MINLEQFAGVLYDAYSQAVGGKMVNGAPLPPWDEFRKDPKKKQQSDAWVVVARTAINLNP